MKHDYKKVNAQVAADAFEIIFTAEALYCILGHFAHSLEGCN